MKWSLLILCISLLLCLSITPVLAYDYTGNFSRLDSVTQTTWAAATDGTGAQAGLIKSWKFNAIEDYQHMTGIFSTDAYTDYTWDYTVQSYAVYVDAYAGSTYMGSGWLGFNNNTATHNVGIYWFPVNWNTHGLTGVQWINFTDPANPTGFAAHGIKDLTHTGQHRTINLGNPGGWVNPSDTTTGYIGSYSVNNQFEFHNVWYMTQVGESILVEVQKTFEGTPFKSTISLWQTDNVLITRETALSYNTFSTQVATVPIKVVAVDANGNYYNSTYYYRASVSIDAEPDTVAINQNTTIHASAGLGSFNQMNWYVIYYEQGDMPVPCWVWNGNLSVFRKATNGFWYQFNRQTSQYDINWSSFPQDVNVQFNAPGTMRLKGEFGFENQSSLEAYTYVTVEGLNTTKLVSFRAQEFGTGYMIRNATISVYDYATGTWSNQTDYAGLRRMTFNTGSYIGYTATAYGWTANYEQDFIWEDRTIPIYMFRPANITAGNNTMWVKVKDDYNKVIEGASVRLDDGQVKYTPSSGVVSFTVIDNYAYQINVDKSGYEPYATVFMVSGTQNGIVITLPRLTVTTAPTSSTGDAITTVPTVDVRTNDEKGSDMVKILYDNGEGIIGLCVVMTVLGLLGFRMK